MHIGCAGKGNWEILAVQMRVDLWLTLPFRRIFKRSLPASQVSPDALPLTSCSRNNTWQEVSPTQQALSDLLCLSLVPGTWISHLLTCFKTQSIHHYCWETSLLSSQCSHTTHASMQLLSILSSITIEFFKGRNHASFIILFPSSWHKTWNCRHMVTSDYGQEKVEAD